MFANRPAPDRDSRVLAGLFALTALAALSRPAVGQQSYQQNNLVSNLPGLARFTDPNLVNPWGITSTPTSPWWVSNNGTGTSTLHDGSGAANALVVTIPPSGMGDPTGVVFSGGANFAVHDPTSGATGPSRFIFASEDGTISGWSPAVPPPPPSTHAFRAVDNSAAGAIYKGLALNGAGGGDRLYAADFHNGRVDVFDGGFAPVNLPGAFSDPNLPSDYAPFNVQFVNGALYVAYAKQDADRHDEIAGAGFGYLDAFDANGTLIRRVASNGALNAPWGMALAPGDFGPLSNALLVGNFGDGRVNAFDPNTGAFLGALSDSNGVPIEIEGLWGLGFGNGGSAGPRNALYFAAGIDDEQNGLFGSLTVVPEPGALSLLGALLPALALLRRRKA